MLKAAIAALAKFGPVQPEAVANHSDTVKHGDDASPNAVDINVLTVVSDGDDGNSGKITVTMTFQANVSSYPTSTKYRVHFDYDNANGIASAVNRDPADSCSITTPDNPSGRVRRTDNSESSTRRIMASFSEALYISRRPTSHPAQSDFFEPVIA